MTTRRTTRLVRVGGYAAEVEIELTEEADGWSPYLSVKDAEKLDQVREALRRGDLKAAGALAKKLQ